MEVGVVWVCLNNFTNQNYLSLSIRISILRSHKSYGNRWSDATRDEGISCNAIDLGPSLVPYRCNLIVCAFKFYPFGHIISEWCIKQTANDKEKQYQGKSSPSSATYMH